MKKNKTENLEEGLKRQFLISSKDHDDSPWISRVMGEISQPGRVEESSWFDQVNMKILWRLTASAASLAIVLILIKILNPDLPAENFSETYSYDPMAILTLSLFGL